MVLKGINQKKNWTAPFLELEASVDDLAVLYEFYKEGAATESELDQHYADSQKLLEAMEFKRMLGAEEDQLSAVVNINSGAGGTESQDWAEMLMRMYIMWGEKNGYKVTELDRQDGDGAGIKSATLQIEGDFP